MAKCEHCNGIGEIEYYHDAGDHFGAGTSPNSEWRTKPCPYCNPPKKRWVPKENLVTKNDMERYEYEKEIADLKAQIADRDRREGELVTDIADLYEELNELREALPDDYSKSKDWRHGGPLERIEWLKAMYNSANEYGSAMEDNCLYAAEELAELRDAAAWYLECMMSGDEPDDPVMSNPKKKAWLIYDDRVYEWRDTRKQAELAIRVILHDKRG